MQSNTRTLVAVAVTIALCAGIASCAEGPVAVPGAFELSSPASNTTGVFPTPTLTWTDATGATSYTLEVDSEDTFSPPLVYEKTGIATNTTSFVVPEGVLAGGTKYYWRVTARNTGGSTVASNAPFSFTVLSSGALVPGFGVDGVVTGQPGAAFTIAIDSTSMYVVGRVFAEDSLWLIEKRGLTDGGLVAEFGAGGVVTSNPSPGYDDAYAIAIDSTAVYVVGHDSSPGHPQWRIEKRGLTYGDLVTGFGVGGVVTSDHGASASATAIAVDSAAMYVAGSDSSSGHPQWRIEKRSLTDGSPVTGFGADGVVTSDPGARAEVAAMAIDSTAMYVVGYDHSPGNRQWRIEKRSLTDGSLVAGFGQDGIVTSNPGAGDHEARAIAIDSTAMYVAGYHAGPGLDSYHWRIEKRGLTGGGLVGVYTSDPGTGTQMAVAIAIDSTAMYVVGLGFGPGPLDRQWRIEKRRLADGGLVTGFGVDGVVTSDPGTRSQIPTDIAIDSTAIYVVGLDYNPEDESFQWRIEKRGK